MELSSAPRNIDNIAKASYAFIKLVVHDQQLFTLQVVDDSPSDALQLNLHQVQSCDADRQLEHTPIAKLH